MGSREAFLLHFAFPVRPFPCKPGKAQKQKGRAFDPAFSDTLYK
jgi:hypothetical protein